MQENRMKRMLSDGKVVVGGWMVTNDAMLTESMGDCGFDFIVVDTEHSAQDPVGVMHHMMALKDTPATPICRVAWNDFVRVKQLLDIGAQGIVFPWISTEEHALQAVSATRYPPAGVRGWGPRRAQRYADNMPDYFAHANDNIAVLCQIETQEGLDNAEAIAKVDGVDALMIGPADLSVNIGVPLDWECPKFEAAVQRVREAADAAGKAYGVITCGAEMGKRWLANGARVIIGGSDSGLLGMIGKSTLAELREAIGEE